VLVVTLAVYELFRTPENAFHIPAQAASLEISVPDVPVSGVFKRNREQKKAGKGNTESLPWDEARVQADVRRNIRLYLGDEHDNRTCCQAAAFTAEFSRKEKQWGKTQDEITIILKQEIKNWSIFNKIKLRKILHNFRDNGCDLSCPMSSQSA
jgi:hypothetical protein